jgi:hypothetical protein
MTQPTLKDAREVWSNIDDDAFDDLIWTCTPYPFASPEREAEMLIELHKRYNGDLPRDLPETLW